MNTPFKQFLFAGIWINFSEFFRNEFLFKKYWIYHYASKNLTFETLPINGVLWMMWGFLLAWLIYKIQTRFSFSNTMIIAWIFAFPMMWISLYNLQVLPVPILFTAIPLSILEIYVALIIMQQTKRRASKK